MVTIGKRSATYTGAIHSAFCRLRLRKVLHALCSSSVRYFGASAWTFALNTACAASSSLGGSVVRVGTGTPTCRKNSSWPAGEQMHSIRTARVEEFRNWCGAFAGIFTVWPARTTTIVPGTVASSSPSRTVNVSSKLCRCGGGPPPGGTCISIRQNWPAVSLPVRRIVYVSPTTPMCRTFSPESGLVAVSFWRGWAGGRGWARRAAKGWLFGVVSLLVLTVGGCKRVRQGHLSIV